MSAVDAMNLVAIVLLFAVVVAAGIGEWRARRKARRDGILS